NMTACPTRLFGCLLAICATAADYDLIGQIVPEIQASVSLHGATSPFQSATLSDARGRFRFHRLAPGAYTVSVFDPERGEARQTVEIGPGVADSNGRVTLTVRLDRAKFESEDSRRRRAMVSARELSIPPTARREYEEAQKRLSRRDVDGAVT